MEVFNHVPMKSLTSAKQEIVRGSPITLNLQLSGLAPASGTRVFLRSDKPSGVFSPNLFPRPVDIPANTDHISIQIPTLPTAAVGRVTVTALAANGRYTAVVEIR